jgi:hypothetical protein
MATVSSSELRRMRQRLERLQQNNLDVMAQLGFQPTPVAFAEAVLGAKLDEWQRQYMTEALERNRVAIAACRQSGKSTVTALFVAWCLIFVPGFQALVASRSLRQAGHFISIIRQAVLTLIPQSAMSQLNRLSLELPNGSSVISIPCAQPDAGRGFSPHMVLLDEAAFAPEPLFRAITPSLAATQGALHMISSPNGRQGYFFEAFEGQAVDIYMTVRVSWTECPRIDPAFIDAEKIALGAIYFEQEYEAKFVTPLGAFFGANALQFLAEQEEEAPMGDLDLVDLETILSRKAPMPKPTELDLQAAMDRTDRVRRLLVD